ncbi:MAG: hypothetical protein HY554_00060 [Elusimicrobia bacterium]|nr:hypothetical protein [Elusimicrobiota bacterium]
MDLGPATAKEHATLVETAARKTAEAVKALPESPAVHVSAARVMIQAGKYDAARRYASRAAELAPDDPWPLVNRGVAEFESCDFPSARRSAAEALRRDPRNRNARAMWSLSQRPAGCNNVTDRLRARYVGAKLLEASAPGRLPIQGAFAQEDASPFDAGQAETGRAADGPVAAGAAARYTREGARRFKALMAAAGDALQGGRDAQAFELATAAILAYPENPRALFIRSVAGMNLKRGETVIADATWGAKLDPENKAQWLALRSNALTAGGRLDAALADAEAALRLAPRAADAWLARARAREALRHSPQEWLADFEQAARYNANFASLRREAAARASRKPSSAAGKAAALAGRDRALWLLGAAAGAGLLFAAAIVLRRRRPGDES